MTIALFMLLARGQCAENEHTTPARSTDVMVANAAISQVMAEITAISNARSDENSRFQTLHKAERDMCNSLLQSMKDTKDLGLLASLQGIIDEFLRRTEDAMGLEQAAQRR